MVWALDHNGTNQYSYTADDSISLSGDRYHEFKINTTTTTTETIFCLCNATGSGNSGEFLTITVNFITPGKMKIETSGYTPGEGTITVNDGADHTIRLEITGSLLELYVDNVLDYSTTHTNPSILDGDFGLYMGCSKYFYADDAFRFFDGLIWDVDVNNQYFYSATNSDHNQSTNLVDNIAANDAIMVNMTTANWIDLGGGVVVEFTFSINSASSVSIESAHVVSSDFQASTASTVSFASAKIQQSDFDINSQSLTDFNSAKIQSSIFEIDSSSTFSVLTGDTNIVEFTFSVNSQSSLSVDNAKVQSSTFDIESQSNTEIESAKVQSSGFNMNSGANVDWSASAIHGRAFAIDSESVFTVVVEGGEPVFIIGLTLELSSDIITLELSPEQEIRELA